jgi:hypothetical protein
MQLRPRFGALFVWLLFFGFATSAAAAAEIGVTIEKRRVTASGLVPGSSALFFSIGLEPTGYESAVKRWTPIVADDDRNGTATLDTDADVPWKSIWVVVDLTNHKYALVTPDEYPLRAMALPPNAFRRREGSLVNSFVSERTFVDALYVSANGGAWVLAARDADETDADGTADNAVTLIAPQMLRVDGSNEKALEFTAGLFFAIDVTQMDVLAVRLNPAMLGGAH